MTTIFIGLFFFLIDFNIDIGSIRIGLVPDFVGYVLLVSGLREIRHHSSAFKECEDGSKIMVVISGIIYILDLFGMMSQISIISTVFGLLRQLGLLYVLYKLVAGIADIQRKVSVFLGAEALKSTWIALAAVRAITIITSMLFLVPLAIAGAVAAAIILIVFIYHFGKTRDMFNMTFNT